MPSGLCVRVSSQLGALLAPQPPSTLGTPAHPCPPAPRSATGRGEGRAEEGREGRAGRAGREQGAAEAEVCSSPERFLRLSRDLLRELELGTRTDRPRASLPLLHNLLIRNVLQQQQQRKVKAKLQEASSHPRDFTRTERRQPGSHRRWLCTPTTERSPHGATCFSRHQPGSTNPRVTGRSRPTCRGPPRRDEVEAGGRPRGRSSPRLVPRSPPRSSLRPSCQPGPRHCLPRSPRLLPAH